MPNPLEDIENRQGQKDIGIMLMRVYQGAYEESKSRTDAFWAVAAWVYAMMKYGTDNEVSDVND